MAAAKPVDMPYRCVFSKRTRATRATFWVLCCGTYLALLVHVGLAYAQRANDPPKTTTLSPYFLIEAGDPQVDRLPLAHTQVDFNISGVIADVVVTQQYKNAGTRPLSARYVFPASTRAAVTGLRMRVGQQTISAVIKEREAAEKRYQAAKAAGETATLLAQDRPNVFTMRVANIMPGDRIEVELHYNELLVPENGRYEFVYPTVVGPRYGGDADAPHDAFVQSAYLHAADMPPSTFAAQGRIAAGIPLTELSVPSHQVSVLAEGDAARTVRLSAGAHGDRDFIVRYRLQGDQVQSGLVAYAGADENVFLLTVQPPQRPQLAEIPPREYVFVLDVSGSMHGFPLDTAKLVLARLADQLRPQDSFNVLTFSGGSHVLFPRSQPANKQNLVAAVSAINQASGGGATELRPALQRALAMPTADPHTARTFIVVTDGYISAERELFTLVRDRVGDANLFTLGIGSSVNRYLIEGLSRAGFGEAFVVTEPDEIGDAVTALADYVSTPVLTDISVTCEGFDAYDLLPQQIPDLLASRPLVLLGKWRGPAQGHVVVRGYSASGVFTQRIDVGAVEPRVEHRVVSQLWARQRITDISDFAMGAESDAERAEVTALGLRYRLLSKFTSFVAVAEGRRNHTHEGDEQVDQPSPLPLGVEDTAIGGVAGAPEPPLWLLSIPALLVLVYRRMWRAGRLDPRGDKT